MCAKCSFSDQTYEVMRTAHRPQQWKLDADNYTSRAIHDYIGSLALMPKGPIIQQYRGDFLLKYFLIVSSLMIAEHVLLVPMVMRTIKLCGNCFKLSL